ncbi:844_t:CDS:2 [Racocetra fulgida]|uniref:844_t:CDS:1 n=1 Tax=Racocetra fulgida TaxID=60492 RepID=A0A9N9FS86_9GLOM|nr:844_t:CDS:2 [Racocetra fulgida]
MKEEKAFRLARRIQQMHGDNVQVFATNYTYVIEDITRYRLLRRILVTEENRITTPAFFWQDALPYFSLEDIAQATIHCPPELFSKDPSIYPDLYRIYYYPDRRDPKLFKYVPEGHSDALEHARTIIKMDRKSCAATIKMFFKNERERNPALFVYLEESLQIALQVTTPVAFYPMNSGTFLGMLADKTYRKLYNHTIASGTSNIETPHIQIKNDFRNAYLNAGKPYQLRPFFYYYNAALKLSANNQMDAITAQRTVDSILSDYRLHKKFQANFQVGYTKLGATANPTQQFHYGKCDPCFQTLVQYLSQNFFHYEYQEPASEKSSTTLAPIKLISKPKTTTNLNTDDEEFPDDWTDEDSCATTQITNQTNTLLTELKKEINQALSAQNKGKRTHGDQADFDNQTFAKIDKQLEQPDHTTTRNKHFIQNEYLLGDDCPGESHPSKGKDKESRAAKRFYDYLDPKQIYKKNNKERKTSYNQTSYAITLLNHPDPTPQEICANPNLADINPHLQPSIQPGQQQCLHINLTNVLNNHLPAPTNNTCLIDAVAHALNDNTHVHAQAISDESPMLTNIELTTIAQQLGFTAQVITLHRHNDVLINAGQELILGFGWVPHHWVYLGQIAKLHGATSTHEYPDITINNLARITNGAWKSYTPKAKRAKHYIRAIKNKHTETIHHIQTENDENKGHEFDAIVEKTRPKKSVYYDPNPETRLNDKMPEVLYFKNLAKLSQQAITLYPDSNSVSTATDNSQIAYTYSNSQVLTLNSDYGIMINEYASVIKTIKRGDHFAPQVHNYLAKMLPNCRFQVDTDGTSVRARELQRYWQYLFEHEIIPTPAVQITVKEPEPQPANTPTKYFNDVDDTVSFDHSIYGASLPRIKIDRVAGTIDYNFKGNPYLNE